jgi:4-hydroxyphenylpyruvate dioxygenase-like putative hemolysin
VERLTNISKVYTRAGCGGFGKGNFRALFESIERLQAQRGMLLDTNEEQ